MALRDRFYTPATAKAILSWRILVGVGVAAAMAAAGMPLAVAIAVGVVLYVVFVLVAMPKGPERRSIDPFTLSEPWRQLVQGSQAAERKLRATIDGVPAGPLRDRLDAIAAQIRHGIDEAWTIAQQGDGIDDTVRTLDPTALRSKLSTLEHQASETPSSDVDAAVASVRAQLDSADRMKAQSEQTAASLRLTQTRLDELVARAGEVKVGTVDTDAYRREVDDVVLQLEALRQAVQETGRS